MAACDQVSKFIQRVQGTGSGGGVPIIFPTAAVAQLETSNGTVALAAGAATTVIPLNNSRTGAIIVNNTGNTLRLRIGGPAGAADIEFPTGTAYEIAPDNLGKMPFGLVSIFNPTGGILNVTFQEF